MNGGPSPRDWRWVVGTIGKVLIATGVLMFAFVGYQLWGTGIEYARAQDRLDDEFDQLLASATTTATVAPTSTSAGPTATDQPATSIASTGSTAPATSTTTPAPPVPDVAAGDVIARIEIPTIGLDAKVVSGVQPDDLKLGPGHYPDTPMPGQFGNAAIAGHRTTYGQPFHSLDEVEPGDEIAVTTVQGRFVYRATGSEIVAPDRSDVVATDDPTGVRLTLTTCHPRYSATERLIVRAELDAAASAPPQPSNVDADADEPAPTLPGEPLAPTSATSAGVTVPDTIAPTVPTTASSAPPPAGGDPSGGAADAFAHGWFSDDAAFAQVALWGAVLSAIGVGAWLVSRRAGRNWVGALAGIVPFVVVLYFFFQNVNRLLPAAL